MTESAGSSRKWSADDYETHARFVSELGLPLLDVLDAQPGERILDLGCGDGALTEKIAASGASVLGIDLSSDMLCAARRRGLDVRHMDARQMAMYGQFEAVLSNAVLHWINTPETVLAGVGRALRPGGRFVGEFGGHGNVAAIVTALLAAREILCPELDRVRNPWFYPTVEQFSVMLRSNGFEVKSCALIPRPTPLPTGIEGWLKTFAAPFTEGLEKMRQEAVLACAKRLLVPSLRDHRGCWTADYVRLRFHAVRA